MSNVYNLEPPTKGKVILKTSLGEIDIELWPKEAPKAVRNFVQLCLEGYYDGVSFHRIIKGFMAQAGDATGTGVGEESIYGQPFKDEFHSRLKFNHRGQVACANANAPHTNGSQFFITFDRCDHLDRKNTIFGKVTGDSIYNLMHMNELETDEDDRPVHPPVIQEVEVLWNPFEDIVPRSTREEREAAAAAKRAQEEAAAKMEKKSLKKNLGLLSFGEEADTEDQATAEDESARRRGVRSAHDVIEDARLLRERTEPAEALRRKEEEAAAERQRIRASVKGALNRKVAEGQAGTATAAPDQATDTRGGDGDDAEEADRDDFGARMRSAAMKRRQQMGDETSKHQSEEAARGPVDADEDEDDEIDDGAEPVSRTEERRDRALQEGKASRAQERISKRVRVEDAELLTGWQRTQAEFKQRRKLAGDLGAKEKLAKMKAFQDRLRSGSFASTSAAPAAKADTDSEAAHKEAYNGKVRSDLDHDQLMPAAWRLEKYLDADDDEDIKLDSLRGHKLVYNKERPGDDMARRDDTDDLVVLDPLAAKGGEKFNRAKAREKKMNREWVGRGQG